MSQLVELNNTTHANLKVKKNCALEVAKTQHTLNLRVIELSKAACNFPVFFTRLDDTGEWALSAVTNFEAGGNLFVENNQWQATYYPSAMQTYPIFLMQKPNDEKNYTLGIDESNPAFTQDEGEALFDDKGNASLYLSQTKAILESDITDVIHSFQFLNEVTKHNLYKSLDLLVHFLDGRIVKLTGLHTIDEEKLRNLPEEDFLDLRKKGYLPPLYAMLSSLYQINALIKKHNDVEGSIKIQQVKMEVAKSNT